MTLFNHDLLVTRLRAELLALQEKEEIAKREYEEAQEKENQLQIRLKFTEYTFMMGQVNSMLIALEVAYSCINNERTCAACDAYQVESVSQKCPYHKKVTKGLS